MQAILIIRKKTCNTNNIRRFSLEHLRSNVQTTFALFIFEINFTLSPLYDSYKMLVKHCRNIDSCYRYVHEIGHLEQINHKREACIE